MTEAKKKTTKCITKQKTLSGGNGGISTREYYKEPYPITLTPTQNSFGTSDGAVISKKEQYDHEWESILLKDKKKVLNKMSITDKITWGLTAVNVAILISLVIKNI